MASDLERQAGRLQLLREEQEKAGLREIARISAAHRLNGHDCNVLQQWRDSGFAGRRPELSFEIQQRLEQEKQHELREQLRAAEAEHRRREQANIDRAKWEARQEAERQWRLANPELAKQQDEEKEERLRKAAERYQRLQDEQRQQREAELRDRDLKAKVHYEGALSLDTDEFLRWCSIADEDDLKNFDAECLSRARQLRPPSPLKDWLDAFLSLVR